MIRLVHSGTPVPQGRSRHGRWGAHYPKTSVEHRESLVAAFEKQMPEQPWLGTYHRVVYPIEAAVSIHIHLAGPRANSDLDNHAKMVLDALVDAGVLAADDVRVVAELTLTRQLDVPKSQRHTAVEIMPWVP